MSTKEPYDSGSKTSVKKADRLAYHLREKMHNGIVKICNDPDSRYVLGRFLDVAGAFRDLPQVPTPDFMFEHGRATGMKAAGLWWLTEALLRDPDIIGKLQRDDESPLPRKQEINDDGKHPDDLDDSGND